MILFKILFMLIICFLIGCLVEKKYSKLNATNVIINGYILVTVYFQILSTPFMYFETRFDYLYYLFIISIFFACIVAVVKINKNIKQSNASKHSFGKDINRYLKNKMLLVMLTIILIQIVLVVVFQHKDADDSFYVTQINSILDKNRIMSCDQSTGLSQFPFNNVYKLVGYEVLLAVISKVFNIHGAILSHSILPILFIPLYYLIMYNTGKKLFKNNNKYIFILIISILNIFSGYSVYSQGAFLLFRIWQGKALIVNITLPLLLNVFLEIFDEEKIKKASLIQIFCILVLGMHYSTIGIYIVPMAYLCFTITYFVKTRNVKECMKFSIPIIMILPFVILKFKILMFDFSGLSDIIANPDSLNYIEVVKNANGKSMILLLFIISTIIICVFGNRTERYIFSLYPIITFVTILNPLFKNIIAQKITGIVVYWRVFWLLFINCSIAVASVIIITRSIRYKKLVLVSILTALVINGEIIFNSQNFSQRDNWYKINSDAITFADVIVKENPYSILLAPENLAVEFRQYSPKVYLAWSRSSYVKDNYKAIGKEEEFGKINGLYHKIYSERKIDSETIKDLKFYDIKYIVLPKTDTGIEFNGIKKVSDAEYYSLFRITY